MQRLLLAAMAVVLVLPALPAQARAVESSTSLADWILEAQLDDGAITAHTDRRLVWPYLANQAAMGLAQSHVQTGAPHTAQAAWRWLEWYAAHQDEQGFVTDYEVTGGVPVSTGDMDSTDAYAGTFLLAVEHTYAATGDRQRLQGLRPAIAAAVGAIEATQDADGLTWARPGWRTKYLMDQAETYAGLRAAARLGATLDDPALALRATRDADLLQAGVDGLFDHERGTYDWAVGDGGVHTPARWDRLYPDALQQVWAVAYGLVPPARAEAVMRRFLEHHPDWHDPTRSADIEGRRRATGYWTVVAWALARVGMQDTAEQGAQRVLDAADAAGHRWPFTTADAAHLLLLGAQDTLPHPAVRRVPGTDAATTTPAISDHVVLTGAHRFPDALAARIIADRLGAPLVLSPTAEVPDALAATIRQLRARTVTVVGGPGTTSAAAVDQLRDTGLRVRRLSQPGRYVTVAVALLEVLARGLAALGDGALPDTVHRVARGLHLDGATTHERPDATGPAAAAVPVVLSAGAEQVDALATAAVVARDGALLLAMPDDLTSAPAVQDALATLRGRIGQVTVIGDDAVRIARVRRQVQALVDP